MKTDKLYYQIFLAQPALLAELIPGLPADCEFEYIAPVVKESEFRLDGLLMPLTDNPEVPVIFIEAQMQADPGSMGATLPKPTSISTNTKSSGPGEGC
jgi:predicted transposase YdaD